MTTPKKHIQEIRKTKFSIGGEPNPLTEDLHQAVKNLSAELYAKDVHFLMELIQNAEDNDYPEGVDPSLEFIITSRDITGTGALATLLVFNNEIGFSKKNIESLCSVGRSTKKGNRKRGYIGEKGIGFKSVFLITSQPYIFSNGYRIRFNEDPCPYCNLGYIVPEWVEQGPMSSDLQQLHGNNAALPATTLVLPLKPDKVKPVKEQLSTIHPEVLLFLSKIKQLLVKEDNEVPKFNTVNAVSISSETNFVTRKNIDAESYTLHLSAEEIADASETECSYYMWKQRFPVRQANRVEKRMDVEEWVITLAFPNSQRLCRGMNSPGIYAFLPTEMVTNFPFIIQADFLLASSREAILLDNTWNTGILQYVSTAFVNAFISLVKTTDDAPVSSLPRMFHFLPVTASPYPELNAVRESIRSRLLEEHIIPCQSYTDQRLFSKPREVGRIVPYFWSILNKARKQGVGLHNLSSHGRYILNTSFDKNEYDHVLKFLEVKYVDAEWYAKCIRSTNLVSGVSEDGYLELLHFISINWSSCFEVTNIKNIPLIKYVSEGGSTSLCTIDDTCQENGERILIVADEPKYISWLIDWNKEFRCVADLFLVPKSTQEAIWSSQKRQAILAWLKDQVKVTTVTVYDYASLVVNEIKDDRRVVIAYAHFLFHSLQKNYLSHEECRHVCDVLPLVDDYGCMRTQMKGVLLPANISKWVCLMGSNPWRDDGYAELGEEYLHQAQYAGSLTIENQLVDFLKDHVGASDIPTLFPPNAALPTAAAPLTKSNALLLLDWIHHHMSLEGIQMPEKFVSSIKQGSWMKVSIGGSPGYGPPSHSFILPPSYENILQNAAVLVDIPLVDQGFYGAEIEKYKEELKAVGVMLEFKEACEFMGKHLMSLAGSASLTKRNVLSILNFIKFLRERYLPVDDFIHSIKDERWLRTSRGDHSPVGSVLYGEEWRTASLISDIPFVDIAYYGDEILAFREELQLLGVRVGFNQSYQLIVDHLKASSYLNSLSARALLLALECMRFLKSPEIVVGALKDAKCLKTNSGYKCPGECYLFDPDWGILLQVLRCFPLIDQNFYGSQIYSYNKELKQMGVVVDLEVATWAFVHVFIQHAKSSSLTKENVMLTLECYRKLKRMPQRCPANIWKCIRSVKWLRTRLGDYRLPKECILFGQEWAPISEIALLPFIDDGINHYGEGIGEYKKELKSLGVAITLKYGANFVIEGIYLPDDPSVITRANVFSLLQCIRIVREQKESLPQSFLKKVSRNWLKTYAGYRSPDKCLFFTSEWGSLLEKTDGPFIDTEFYGSEITAYEKELGSIGVVFDVREGCNLLVTHLDCHSENRIITRIYKCLSKLKWVSDSEAAKKIWIPNVHGNGYWLSPEECILRDKGGLFVSRLNVLDKYYDKEVLEFFSRAFEVRFAPSIEDYYNLWKHWEASDHKLSVIECCVFWASVIRQWSSGAEMILSKGLAKLPVDCGAHGILLFDKRDVFIADDLLLKDLFCNTMFVWYPRLSVRALSRSKLNEAYRKIGVRTLSECVQKEELSVVGCNLKQVDPGEVFIGKELIKLILGFLADPSFNMEAKSRHDAVRPLLNLSVLETVEPISVSYCLSLGSGAVVKVNATQMIRWEREDSKFFVHKLDRLKGGQRAVIEYATYFSDVISRGVLWGREDIICELTELIKLGVLLEFNVDALRFLAMNKNLQIFTEDEEFLSATFPSE